MSYVLLLLGGFYVGFFTCALFIGGPDQGSSYQDELDQFWSEH